MEAAVRVLAIDPGERVGWAHGEFIVDYHGVVQPLTITGHGISFLRDGALAVHQAVVVEDRYDVVVYETWRLRAHKAKQFAGNDMQSSQLIGMIRLCAWLNPRVQLVSQGPAAKTKWLKALPQHHPELQAKLDAMPSEHDHAHDGDALMHLWTYYAERYL